MLFLSVFTAEPGVEHALKVLLRHNLSFDRWKGIRKSQRLAGGGSVRFSQLLGSRTWLRVDFSIWGLLARMPNSPCSRKLQTPAGGHPLICGLFVWRGLLNFVLGQQHHSGFLFVWQLIWAFLYSYCCVQVVRMSTCAVGGGIIRLFVGSAGEAI